MRRMYSEQELTNVIKAVFEQELEDGALDDKVVDAVDAYLVEHPVDITALEGQDISCNSVDADATITGAEIVEKMSGYSFSTSGVIDENLVESLSYAGVVKNGNKITFVVAGKLKRTDTLVETTTHKFTFTIPSSVGSKLFETTIGGVSVLDARFNSLMKSYNSGISKPCLCQKNSNTSIFFIFYGLGTDLEVNTDYSFRIEQTFLLSDSLISE